ncbi:hypothetical protein PL81_00175, partial [Streptomyces sp. RSD-27]
APKRKPILPSLAGDRAGEAMMLRRDAHAGLEARLRRIVEVERGIAVAEAPADAPTQRLDDVTPEYLRARFPDYFERLDFEIDVIVQMGFPGYFLIVADFIK